MTKKEKKQKIEKIDGILKDNGFKLDSFGNYKRETDTHAFRMKIKAINLRFEVKKNGIGSSWYKIFSYPIGKIKVDGLDSYLKRRIK
jgi:hypothetical protein